MTNEIIVNNKIEVEDNQEIGISIFEDNAVIFKITSFPSGLTMTTHMNTDDLLQMDRMIDHLLRENRKRIGKKFD